MVETPESRWIRDRDEPGESWAAIYLLPDSTYELEWAETRVGFLTFLRLPSLPKAHAWLENEGFAQYG